MYRLLEKMMDLEIKGFLETSFLDWDGKIVSVVYVGHCNFSCPFCHNAGLVTNPGQYQSVPKDKIINYLKEHSNFIDGICLTGGEPCLHKDRGLIEFMGEIKRIGMLVKLDTNGTDPETIKELIEKKLVDYIAMDIKAPLDKKYDELSGAAANLEAIKKSIKIIIESNVPHEFRTTIVPGKIAKEDIARIAGEIKGAEKYVLQQFIADNCWKEEYRSFKPLAKEELLEMEKLAKEVISNTIIRGA
jgi:pyruvate formate lyase activating enzyme